MSDHSAHLSQFKLSMKNSYWQLNKPWVTRSRLRLWSSGACDPPNRGRRACWGCPLTCRGTCAPQTCSKIGYKCLHMCLCAHACLWIYVCIYIYIYVYMCIYIYVSIHVCIFKCINKWKQKKNIYIYMYTYIYNTYNVYIYIYIYIHTYRIS